MDKKDLTLLKRILSTDQKLKRLYLQHQDLEEKLSHYENRNFLTAKEEQEEKKLKFKKLAHKEEMMRILATYEESVEQAA